MKEQKIQITNCDMCPFYYEEDSGWADYGNCKLRPKVCVRNFNSYSGKMEECKVVYVLVYSENS